LSVFVGKLLDVALVTAAVKFDGRLFACAESILAGKGFGLDLF